MIRTGVRTTLPAFTRTSSCTAFDSSGPWARTVREVSSNKKTRDVKRNRMNVLHRTGNIVRERVLDSATAPEGALSKLRLGGGFDFGGERSPTKMDTNDPAQPELGRGPLRVVCSTR